MKTLYSLRRSDVFGRPREVSDTPRLTHPAYGRPAGLTNQKASGSDHRRHKGRPEPTTDGTEGARKRPPKAQKTPGNDHRSHFVPDHSQATNLVSEVSLKQHANQLVSRPSATHLHNTPHHASCNPVNLPAHASNPGQPFPAQKSRGNQSKQFQWFC